MPAAKGSENGATGVQTFTDSLGQLSSDPNAELFYALEVLNSYSRSAGLSNQVEVPAVPTLPAPLDLKAQLKGEGVLLAWSEPPLASQQSSSIRFVYRIYRRETGGNNQVLAGEVPLKADFARTFIDSSIEWEKTYQYRITIVTIASLSQGKVQQVEGDDSPEITVVAHDVFPPATPSGLQAVSSGPGQKPFVDLIWAPDTDADLAGYNVYRSEEGSEPKKLNSGLVKSPAFRDGEILAGHQYRYAVSAVDMRGNESALSQSAEERIPNQ